MGKKNSSDDVIRIDDEAQTSPIGSSHLVRAEKKGQGVEEE